MNKIAIQYEDTKALLYGSLILGCGGGGGLSSGQFAIDKAFEMGQPTMVKLDSLEGQDDAVIITTSAVGAPAATEQFVTADDYNRVVELIDEKIDGNVYAFLTNELGAGSTFNAFIQSATTGKPMLDAACNGRAHPLGTQGSMGLSETPEYRTIQTAVGGNPATHKYIELTTEGTVASTSRLVREAADQAGGLVVVARNPVDLAFVRGNAAIGALTMAKELGDAYLSGKDVTEQLTNVVDLLEGKIEVAGPIEELELITVGGLDKGSFVIQAGQNTYKMHICNEYMALDMNGERLVTFPDLLMTFDSQTGVPVTSAELTQGQEITILSAPKENLLLGAGMFDESGYEAIEQLIDIELVKYNQDIIR